MARRRVSVGLGNVLVEDCLEGVVVPRTDVVGRAGDVLAGDNTDALSIVDLDARGFVVRAPRFGIDRERGRLQGENCPEG